MRREINSSTYQMKRKEKKRSYEYVEERSYEYVEERINPHMVGDPLYFIHKYEIIPIFQYRTRLKDGHMCYYTLDEKKDVYGDLFGYYPNGCVAFMAYFIKSEPHGDFHIYDDCGILIQTLRYDYGKQISGIPSSVIRDFLIYFLR